MIDEHKDHEPWNNTRSSTVHRSPRQNLLVTVPKFRRESPYTFLPKVLPGISSATMCAANPFATAIAKASLSA